jgi:hypothetical protein
MKNIIIIALLLVVCARYDVSAQSDPLEISLEAVDKAFAENPDDALVVNIQGDHPGYTIMLFDKEPWKGAYPVETVKDVQSTTYTFMKLKPGEYHVCVLDAKENMDCKKVKISRR